MKEIKISVILQERRQLWVSAAEISGDRALRQSFALCNWINNYCLNRLKLIPFAKQELKLSAKLMPNKEYIIRLDVIY